MEEYESSMQTFSIAAFQRMKQIEGELKVDEKRYETFRDITLQKFKADAFNGGIEVAFSLQTFTVKAEMECWYTKKCLFSRYIIQQHCLVHFTAHDDYDFDQVYKIFGKKRRVKLFPFHGMGKPFKIEVIWMDSIDKVYLAGSSR